MNTPKKAILFIHGYMGSHNQFNGIKERLEGCGADFITHVLEGHGSTFDDFLHTDAETWQKGVDEHVGMLRQEYDEILLVGHSMGGLLATCTATRNHRKITGIVAIGYPISIRLSVDWFKNGYLASLPYHEGENPRVTAARDLAGVPVYGAVDTVRAYPKSAEFMKAMLKARKELPKLKVPLTIINFQRDEIVSSASIDFVRKNYPDAKYYLSKKSYHFWFDEKDADRMASIIRSAL